MIRVALSQLLERNIRLDVAEVVAIARSLAAAPGVPAVNNVEIGSDGSAACMTPRGEPTVPALAALMNDLLPDSGVPAALRYAVARGMGAVTAPPFPSVAAFSDALARFQAGDGALIIRELLVRARPAPVGAPPVVVPLAQPIAPEAPQELLLTIPPAAEAAALEAVSLAPRARRSPALAAAAAALLISGLAGFAGAELWRSRAVSDSHVATSESQVRSRSQAAPATSATPVTRPDRAPSTVTRDEGAPLGTAGQMPRTARKDASPDLRGPAYSPQPITEPQAAGKDVAPRNIAESAAPSPAGKPVPVLPREDSPAFSPAFSTNGTALFFQTGGPRDSSSAIAMASPGTSPSDDLRIMKIVDDGARNYHARPSPDGDSIAFDSDREGERGVYVANRDGSHVRRISGPGYAALPTWSPDGRRLAFVRAEANAPSVWNLWIQPLEGGAARRITNYKYGQTWTASWFPDGHRIAYSHEDELTVLDLETGRPQRFTAPVRGRLVRTPAVSPDGTRIVFQVFHAGAWILNLRDGSMECVLADPTAEEFAWAPDGRRFAFHSRRDGEWGVYVLSASPAAH